MSIRLKTIIGIVLIQTIALAIVVWANLHVLVQSNEQLLAEQAKAVARLSAEPAVRAYQAGPQQFEQEVLRIKESDPRITKILILEPGIEEPQSSSIELVQTVKVQDESDESMSTRVALALDRGTMRAALDSALIRSIAIAGLEILASIAFSLWLANFYPELIFSSPWLAAGGCIPSEGLCSLRLRRISLSLRLAEIFWN